MLKMFKQDRCKSYWEKWYQKCYYGYNQFERRVTDVHQQ